MDERRTDIYDTYSPYNPNNPFANLHIRLAMPEEEAREERMQQLEAELAADYGDTELYKALDSLGTPAWATQLIYQPIRQSTNLVTGAGDTFIRGALNVPALLLRGAGMLSESTLGGQSSLTDAANWLNDVDADYVALSDKIRHGVTGDNPTYLDNIIHGAGTSLGYMAYGGGAKALFNVLGKSNLVANIGRFMVENISEAITEAANTSSELYGQDKTRGSDAFWSGMYSLAPNSIVDALQGIASGKLQTFMDEHFIPSTNGMGMIANAFIKNLIREQIDENLQEPRQQLIETAAKNTFKSGDMSIGNYLNNLGKETSQVGEYFKQTMPETIGSTFLTSLITAPLGISPNITQVLQQEYKNANEAFDNLKAQRDELQTRINDMSHFYSNDAEQDLRTAAQLDEINTQLQGLDEIINNFWGGTTIIDNPVQDDAGFDLFADIHANTPQAQNVPSVVNGEQNAQDSIQTGIPLGSQDNQDNQEQGNEAASLSSASINSTPETQIEGNEDSSNIAEDWLRLINNASYNQTANDNAVEEDGNNIGQRDKADNANTPNAQESQDTSLITSLGQETNQQANAEESTQSFAEKITNWVTGLLGNNNANADSDTTTTTVGDKNHVGTIVYNDGDNKKRKLTVKSGEFSDNHPNEKKYFGRYMEFTDDNGNVVARYSPYTRILQMADNVQDADIVRKAIINEAEQRGNKHLRNFGYFDNTGRLADDGNEDFRNKHRARLDTNLPGSSIHPNNLRQSAQQRIDTRTKAQQKVDAVEERRARKRVENDIVKKLEKAYDDIIAGKSIKENPIEGIAANAKQLYRKYLTRKHRNMRNSFRRTARATAIGYQALAHAYGMKVEEFVKSRPFDAISYLQAENDERINTPQKNIPKGTVQKAQIQVVPSYIDKEKKYHPEQLIMILGREADPSSALHEFGHGFLTELRGVATTANDLPQDFRQDWLNLTKWLGVSDIDFTTPHSSWTDDQKERWQNAQEKWAVGLEKYFAEGKAPSTWLKGVFNKFKTWMAHIYGNAKNIRYMGEDKQFHSVEITPEVRKFYDNLFKDIPFVPNEEARQARLAKLKDVQQGAGNEVYYNQISPKNQGSSKFNLPFDPDELRTESGLPIDEKAKPSEMIVTPYGSLDLGYIPENVAEFPSGSIRANVGSVIHAEKEHGKQIRGMGYDNAKELLLDVLNNYSEIRRGTGKALLLSAQGDAKHSAMGVVELVDDNGIYRVKTLRVTRDRYLKNKQLLFTRSEPHATGPDSGLTFSSEHTQSQGKSELYARQSSNLNESLGFNGLNVNTPNVEKPHIKRSNNTFVTREDIERYDQLSIQGTPHIIIDNQFGLEYIGTGEGHQSYAWGLYFAQNPKVAETYRRIGKKNSGFNKVSLKLSNGKTFTFDDLFNQMEELRNAPASEASKLSLPEGVSPEGIFSAIKEFIYQYDDKYARNPDAWDFSRIKSEKLSELENLAKQPEYAFQSNSLEEAIRAINNIADFSVDSFSNGNMYFADIPENDVLLDWDTKKQPPKVKKAIKKVLAKLYDMGAYDDDVEKVAKSKTGEELYQNLRDALEPFVEDDSLPFQFKGKPIPRSDMAASLLLNQAGIPGLRYFDAGSRGDKQGTHNFVIWNTDMIKLLGLSKDSDEDAKQYFKEQQAKMQAERKAKGKTQGSTEHYSQIVNNQQNAEAQTSIAAKNLEKALEISRQQLNNVAQKYRGTEQWLKAPNGEKTNLSERQWLQVRTPNFKRWFGDWENDPKNASKVIDENGEPRVVYHGTPKVDFSVFRTEYGAYFTPDKGYAKTYAKYLESPTSKIYDVFLNIRKPFDTRNLTEQNIFKNEFFRKYGNGSPLSDRGLLDWTDADDMIDFLKEKEYDYDGLILDEGGIPDFSSETKFNWRGISYVPLNPTQIKSATNNNGNFAPRTDEIYQQIIGVKGAQEIDKRNGNTWLMDNLKIAKDMRKGKLSAKKIRMATGWELAPDRKWRYEIMDGKVNVEVLDDMLKTESSRRLKDLYDNNELYKAYPNLAEIKVLYFAGLPLGTIAAYGDDTIVLNPWHSPEVLASSFIHEIQHAVQDIEGFAAGGNPDIFKEAHAEEMDKIMNINNKRNDLIHKIEKDEPSIWQQINEVRKNIQRKGLTLEEYQKALDKIYSRNIHYGKEYKELSKQSNKLYEKLVKKYGEYFNPFNLYKRLGGEIEARNAETRANFTEEQRRNTLLSDTEDATDWIIRDTDGTLHDWKADNMPLSESYAQIGKQHKADMGAALENALTRDTKLKQKYSRDGKEISTEQRAAIIKNAIDEIEKLGEEHKLPHKNGNPKLEKLAFHWFLNGNIILPEDGYKVVNAIKISERYHFDPMNYSDPNEILAEYNIQDIKNSERVDPDTVKEFSNKVDYGNGITVYKVANTKAGQLAVRRIIDTHWGKGANPWCLAARVDGDSEELETAWDYWNDYDSVTKRIAFQNGKLRAFCASDDGKNQWWNSKDKAAEDEIPYIRREDNKTIEYGYDEKTGESRKISEILPNGTELRYYPNGNVESKALPDKDKTTYYYYENGKESSMSKNGQIVITWHRNGIKAWEKLPDGTILEWYKNRNRKKKVLPNDTSYYWYENGLLKIEDIINDSGEGTCHSYIDGIIKEGSDEFARLKKTKALHKDSEGNWRQLKRMSLPNMTSYGWYDNGNLESAKLPDGSERTWWENGNQKTEILPGNIRREWYKNGNPKYERLSYRESRYWYENGNRQSETLPNGEERSWYENGQIKDFRYWDVHIHWYENGNLAQKTDGEKFSEWRKNGKLEHNYFSRERIEIQYDENKKVNSVFLLGEDKELTGKEAEDYFNDFKSEHPEYFVAEDTSAYSKDDEAEAHYPKGQTADEYLANSKDAEDASLDESKPNPEKYNQFISIDAAERLAEAGLIAQSTGTTETLGRAKELDAKHMPVSFIWRETGWVKGKDGHWRTEIPDGEIYDTFFQHPKSRTVKLKAFYKNPILYAAYPELADMPLKIKKFDYNDNTAGYYDEIRKTIAVSQKYLESQNYDILHDVLIHEIQHAIQNSEGWEAGSELSREGRKIWGIINRLIHSMPHELQDKIVNAYNAMNAMKNGNTDEVDKIVATMNKVQKARWAKILDYREKFNVELKKYESVAGEVEARNTGIRRNFDMAKRRNTPPTLTEDTPRSKQILKHEVSRQASSNKNSFLNNSDEDAQEYFHTIDYNKARIDSLDNDSDVQDYSKGDHMAYMSHIDDIANAHTDALDNRPDIEKYNQVIGEKGAKSIDSINGNNKMMNALQMAKKMNSKGVKPRTIKRATGWELGTEGKWKYEIQDGKLHNPEGKQYLSLRDFYENQQLFTAYPSFNDINVAFDIEDDMHESPVFNETPIGYFDKETLTFHLQRNFKNHWKFIDKLPETDYRHDEVQAIKSWLVGKLQELIQSRENFAMARSLDWFSDRSKPVQRVDDNGKLYWTAVNERPERAMKHSAGNIEVQNVQARTDVSPELRREILLSDTEPVPKNEQLVTNWKTKSENYMADEYANGLFDAQDFPDNVLYGNGNESYAQIGKQRKADFDALLAKHRTDLSPEERKTAIDYIELLGEIPNRKGYPKLENAAVRWLMYGHIHLPQDGYKIMYAIKLAEQHNIDVTAFKDPNDILVKYTMKPSNKPINPDKVREFSNKIDYGNGITVYDVENTRKGQAAVRRIIDTHWGKDANPWCLAARINGNLDEAWNFWNDYNRITKRIAFYKGKVVAFCASYKGENEWWDRKDISSSTIPFSRKFLKDKEYYVRYGYNEKTGKVQKIDVWETADNGTYVREWHDNGQLAYANTPNGVYRWHDNGHSSYAFRIGKDFAVHYIWDKQGDLTEAHTSNGTLYQFDTEYDNKKVSYPVGLERITIEFYNNGQLKYADLHEGYPNVYYTWNKEGHLVRAGFISDGYKDYVRYWDSKGQICEEIYCEFIVSYENNLVTVDEVLGSSHKTFTGEEAIKKLAEIRRMYPDFTKLPDYITADQFIAKHPETFNDKRVARINDIDSFDDFDDVKNAADFHDELFDEADETANTVNPESESYSQITQSNNINDSAVRSPDDFLTPEARRQVDAVRTQYQGTPQWLKAPNGNDSKLDELQWLLVRTPNFKQWFGDWENNPEHASKILDENGEPKVVYHGTGRADRIGGVFRSDRATSGPMAFFTDNKEIAENYSKNKADTSLSREGAGDYHKMFFVEEKVEGRRKPQKIFLEDYWHYLPYETKEKIAKIAPTITYDNDYEIISKPNNKMGTGGYELHIREAKGNHLKALIAEWLDSANLFNEEEKFLDVLKLVGLDNVKYLDPNYREEAVYPVFMNMRNPFNTANISESDLKSIRRSAVAAERFFDPNKAYDSDAWDKTTISPMDWLERLEDDIKENTTHAWTSIPDFVTNRLKKLGYDGIQDTGGKYHTEKHNVYIPFKSTQIKSSTKNNGNYKGNNPEIYHQTANGNSDTDNLTTDSTTSLTTSLHTNNLHTKRASSLQTNSDIRNYVKTLHDNPFVESYSQIQFNDKSETLYRNSYGREDPKQAAGNVKRTFNDFLKGFKGDFPLLAGKEARDKDFTAAREILRIMNRNTKAKAHMTMLSLYDSLHKLSPEQFDIFSRMMMLNDIHTFAKNNPDADNLPLGYDREGLLEDWREYKALSEKDKDVIKAIKTEYDNNNKARNDLINMAKELGLVDLAKKIKSADLFLVQYANILDKDSGFNTNYVEATAMMRNAMLQDFEKLLALKKLEQKGYDIRSALEDEYGKNWDRHIPKGYSVFNPLEGNFITSAASLQDEVLKRAFFSAMEPLGMSREAMNKLYRKVAGVVKTRSMVMPTEIVKTLESIINPIPDSALTKFAQAITSPWKKHVLYFPTRAFKYNLRNLTGDLDAVLAGDPTAVRYVPQALKELYTAYYGDGADISQELKEFQARGGALTVQSVQELGDYREMKKFNALINELSGKEQSTWKNLPRQSLDLLDKVFNSGIQNFSDFREQWLRYAAYLDYLQQMRNNNGVPRNFGASVREEVMAIDDIRDRAFKLANELLGAYDQVSESGKQLRKALIPFYSWMEVNAKRYVQLFKNGLTEDDFFTAKLPQIAAAQIPGLTYKLAKTWFLLNFFSLLVSAFNHLFFPKDEEELPPEIQSKPHITLGHDDKGNIRYFSQVGAYADALEWFALDTFRYDVKRILNGQETVTDWLSRFATAPLNKVFGGLSPFIKTPIEVSTGISLYPDMFNPRPMRDRLRGIAQSFGLSWPYKAAAYKMGTGETYSNWDEFRKLFIYLEDAEYGAYNYARSLVRQYKANKLGIKTSFSASETGRSNAMRKFRAALRLNDKAEADNAIEEYIDMAGTKKSAEQSINNMNPLHDLKKEYHEDFNRWMSKEDRVFFDRAMGYYNKFATKALKIINNHDFKHRRKPR